MIKTITLGVESIRNEEILMATVIMKRIMRAVVIVIMIQSKVVHRANR